MQHCVVPRVLERAEDGTLVVARVLEQCKCVVGVGRHDRTVEAAHDIVVRAYEHSLVVAAQVREPAD